MKKINMSHLDTDFYQETLENGLEIYMIPYENKKNYFISYATKYGSDVISFTDKNQITYKPPLGIAHFLEHKMFEEESGEDPFTFFSKSGTDSNASTSFDSTQYIMQGEPSSLRISAGLRNPGIKRQESGPRYAARATMLSLIHLKIS